MEYLNFFSKTSVNKIKSNLKQISLRRLAIFLVPAIIVASCTEPMDLELDSTFTRLVVEGAVTTDTGNHQVRLSSTTDFYYNTIPPAVSGATVKISDGSMVIELTENDFGSGVYETPADFFGEVGKTYTLMIELEEEIGGHTAYSASCLLRPTAQPDSIQIEYQPTWGEGFWEIKLYAQDPPSNDFYKFLTFINDVLVTDSLQEIFVIDDRLFNGNYTNGIGISYLNAATEDNRLNPGDVVTILIANLTEDYAGFILTARTENSFNTPLFSGPPANVQGNISNGAIGFFAAFQPQYVSRIYQKQ